MPSSSSSSSRMPSSTPTGARAGNVAGAAAAVADGLETQIKEWTLNENFQDVAEGATILREEIGQWIFDYLKRNGRQKQQKAAQTTSEHNNNSNSEFDRGEYGNDFLSKDFNSTTICHLKGKEIDDNDRPTTILYGFSVLAKLWSTVLLWVPAFCVDSRLGVYPSRRFALASYFIALIGFIVGIVVAEFVIEPTLAKVLPGLISNVYKLLSIIVVSSEIGYLVYGLFAMAYLVYWRRFVHDFILYYCSFITLPRSYQRKEITKIFLLTITLCILSEPFFAFMSLLQEVEQPFFWPKLSPYLFIIVKTILILNVVTGAICISVLGTVFPIMTNYLVVSIAQYLKILLSKQMSRFKRIHLKSREKHNEYLKSLVDKKLKNLINDYSCDTLTMDWPELTNYYYDDHDNDEDELDKDESYSNFNDDHDYDAHDDEIEVEVEVEVEQLKSISFEEQTIVRKTTIRPNLFNNNNTNTNNSCKQLRAFHENNAITNKQFHDSTTSSLLFLYKNLIKSLSELKGMIEMYESKFGSFHVILICVNGLIVAQWVTAGLTEARLIQDSRDRGAMNSSLSISGGGGGADASNVSTSSQQQQIIYSSAYLTPFAIRVGVGIFTFIISNIIMFLRCDKLPSRMVKMRSRLFKMNVDLACSSLEQRFERLKSTSTTTIASQRKQQANKIKHSGNSSKMQQLSSGFNNVTCDYDEQDWQGLDQVWSLYDQVERMSILANFRLTTNSYYSKNCLLQIFGREVSLVLFYIQIIDIYSYV